MALFYFFLCLNNIRCYHTRSSQELPGYKIYRCSDFYQPLAVHCFPDSSVGKESVCNVGDLGSIPGLGRSPGEGTGYPLQYTGLENPMDSPWGRKELHRPEQLSLSAMR